MKIRIPNLSLVVLIGPSGSGKSTFARSHFTPTEILSSDACRGMVSDDENDQTVTNHAFEVLQFIARKRLALGRLTVIDATNVQPEARKPLVELARQYHCLPVAIVLDIPEKVCQERNRQRADRDFGPHVVRNQKSQLQTISSWTPKGGFRHVFVMDTPEEVEAATVERIPLWNDRRRSTDRSISSAMFTVAAMNWRRCSGNSAMSDGPRPGWPSIALADRSTLIQKDARRFSSAISWTVAPVSSIRCGWFRTWSTIGSALCVPGNHDMKLLRKLQGKNVQITHGLAKHSAEIDALPGRRSGKTSARTWPSFLTVSSAITCSMTASSLSPTRG